MAQIPLHHAQTLERSKEKSRMDNPETLATVAAQNTGRGQNKTEKKNDATHIANKRSNASYKNQR
jgi:hypothetical protein